MAKNSKFRWPADVPRPRPRPAIIMLEKEAADLRPRQVTILGSQHRQLIKHKTVFHASRGWPGHESGFNHFGLGTTGNSEGGEGYQQEGQQPFFGRRLFDPWGAARIRNRRSTFPNGTVLPETRSNRSAQAWKTKTRATSHALEAGNHKPDISIGRHPNRYGTSVNKQQAKKKKKKKKKNAEWVFRIRVQGFNTPSQAAWKFPFWTTLKSESQSAHCRVSPAIQSSSRRFCPTGLRGLRTYAGVALRVPASSQT
ncbi:hypothetical protein QBC42DRAFT_248212 [Cladorrhinum samala]|uniref:Uncharacterized protein n=1 Tax=Cladorrhinum samala TaxID=585594 RepID=A0AAV9HXX6_9PEZI|nr:hypothetical protein QBC42DRAFT_248212 [Cladorrhinum samala]